MAASHAPPGLDPERDFERLRLPARRRFLARARRAGQDGRLDLDAAADDAYQEAWLELQRHPASAAIEHDPAGYLAGVMWHRFHRLELRPVRVETAPLADDAPGGPDPDAVVAQRETLAAVRDALAELPDRERTALLLRAEGFGHEDVAATLGVSRRIARKLAERGRAGLTDRLAAAERCASIASTLRAIGLGWPVRGDRRARLDDHVAHCVTCRATVVALRREGALAATPAVLAGQGALTRLWEVLSRLPGRGGEAVVAAVGTKAVTGCVAAGVCAVGVAALTRPEPPRQQVPAPRATVVSRAPAKPVETAAPAPAARAEQTASPAPAAQTAARRSARRQRETARAQVRTALRRTRAAAKAARDGAAQAQNGAQAARDGAARAQAGGDRARATVPAVTDAAERATDAGNAAAKRATDAAERVRDAFGGLGGG